MTTCAGPSAKASDGNAPLNESTSGGRRWPWLLGAVLLLGAVFRLMWGEVIEYKADEAWVYRLVAEHYEQGTWTPLGMPSSQNVRVPGLSVWVFYPFAYLFGADEPTAVARGVQVSSLAALVLLVLFAWRCVPAGEREAWYWAAAIIAVNPISVIYQRKIWPPALLPVFCMLFLISWWYRDRRWGAFAWGALGALLGQIHASGFLFGAAVWGATLLFDRRSFRWAGWVAGSVLGCLPMIGWGLYLLTKPDRVGDNFFAFNRLIEGKFWSHWATEPLGLDLRGILGQETGDFLAWPFVAGRATYGAAILQVLAAILGAAIYTLVVVRWWRRERGSSVPRQPLSSSALIVRAGFICYGLLLTLAAVRFYRHYLLVTFPLMALWLARLALPAGLKGLELARSRWLLSRLCVVNALCTILLLCYLHAQGGAPLGLFGPSYGEQVRQTGQRPPPVTLSIDVQELTAKTQTNQDVPLR